MRRSLESRLTGVCYSSKSELPGVAYTGEPDHLCGLHRVVYKTFDFSQKFAGVGYTSESRLSSVAYTGESLVQPSRPGKACKGTIPQKSDCEC